MVSRPLTQKVVNMPNPPGYEGLKEKRRLLGTSTLVKRTSLWGNTNPFPQPPNYRWYFTSDASSKASDGSQYTLTEGHPWPSSKKDKGDIGGPFWSQRSYYTSHVGGKPMAISNILPLVEFMSANAGKPGSTGTKQYLHFSPILLPYGGGFPPAIVSSKADLFAKGGTAIARCKPTNSPTELAVGLAEILREGIPIIPGRGTWESRSLSAKNAGNEYLNIQFGWAPLISEIKSFASSAHKADKLWKQYERDAGRLVRRGYKFPVDKSTEILTVTPGSYGNCNESAVVQQTGVMTKTRHTEVRTWFRGGFEYYLPKAADSNAIRKMQEIALKARAVFGLTLDPDVLWNLTPWSWLTDWFVNTGDVISNLSDIAFDGLVMRYGYIMEHTIVTDEFTIKGLRPYKGDSPSTVTICLVTETKQRMAASPYGFGLTWSGFSGRQVAILAALGITRGSR